MAEKDAAKVGQTEQFKNKKEQAVQGDWVWNYYESEVSGPGSTRKSFDVLRVEQICMHVCVQWDGHKNARFVTSAVPFSLLVQEGFPFTLNTFPGMISLAPNLLSSL